MHYYIGIDIGTTHIKTGVFDKDGLLVNLLKTNTPIEVCGIENHYNPTRIVSIVEAQLSEALKEYPNVKGIGITGMAEAGLILNRDSKKEITNIIPWFDKRTVSYAQKLTEEKEEQQFYKTGLRNSFKYGIYKFLWCLDQYTIDHKDALWLSVCDYLYYKLTGKICTEPTFAARTYSYDIRMQKWDLEQLSYYNLDLNNFPPISPSGVYGGYLKGTKIPVALCGHDHICSAVAMLENSKQLCNSCGTAETFVGLLEHLPANTKDAKEMGLVFGPYVEDKCYFGMANLPSSGQSLEWVRKQSQYQEISYERVNELLAGLPNIAGDLLYFPYLSGMGSPLFNAYCSGAFLGLKPQHGLADLLKAVIEGTVYQSKWMLDTGFSNDITEIIVTGGIVANKWWMQCKADILNRVVITTNICEGTLQGAVSLMRKKNGQAGEIKEMQKEYFIPNKKNAMAYTQIYKELYLTYAQIVSQFAGESLQ